MIFLHYPDDSLHYVLTFRIYIYVEAARMHIRLGSAEVRKLVKVRRSHET